MAGRHSYATLRARMSPEAQARATVEAARLIEEIELAQLRQALNLSQAELAQTLQVGQASVAKLEKRTDMYVSTIRRYIEAMGGELEITARFPDHAVKIRTFGDLSGHQPSRHRAKSRDPA